MDSFLKAVTSFKDKIVKTPLERLVHDACTDENWGVANTSLHQISDRSHNSEERSIIMRNIWELLSSPSKEWRRLYKVLNLLDHLLKFGSSSCAAEIKDNIFKIKMFQDFSFREGIEEKGIGVRDKAKYLTQMLSDSRLFDEEREKAQKMWNKMNGVNNYSNGETFGNTSRFDAGSSYRESAGRNEGFGGRDSAYSDSRNDPFARGYTGNPATRSQPASAGLRTEEGLRKEDIFKQPEANKFSLWDAPSIKTAASPSNGELKSLKPPSGFHPANVSAKPSLTHSQSVSSKTFDLLFEEPSFQSSGKKTVDSDLLSANPTSSATPMNPPSGSVPLYPPSTGLGFHSSRPSAPVTSSTSNLMTQDLLFQGSKPSSGPSFGSFQDTFSISGGQPLNPPRSDFSLPSDLFGGSFPSFQPVEKTDSRQGPSQGLVESSAKKLNVNISGGTSMDQMKTFGTSGFSSFVSAPVKPSQPATLESKLFNLDDLEAGQPKMKEVAKNKW